MSTLPWLDPFDEDQPFPHPDHALREPDGLLAVGGSLSPSRLLKAYRCGIFPWYSDNQPILWWSPDPRTILIPQRIKIARSLRKTLRNKPWHITVDQMFAEVIERCSEPRNGEPGTWLTDEMKHAYCRMHQLGYAHSVETWYQDRLVGGLYGIALGRIFFGESMFSHQTDASKVALVCLCLQLQRWQFALIDCQMYTDHLISLGAEMMPRTLFLEWLDEFCHLPDHNSVWTFDHDLIKTLC